MDNPTLQRVSKGEIKGWVEKGALKDLPSTFFDDPISSAQEMGGEVIKDSTGGGRPSYPFQWKKDFFEER